MPDVIVIGGAPGVGKSTLAAALRERLQAPWIDFGRLREFHLRPDWSNQSPQEESMAFENLLAILRNYARHGYRNVLVDDLRDHRVQQVAERLAGLDVRTVTLVLGDDVELRRRVRTRDDGWTDAEAAVAWNRAVVARPAVVGETKMDVTHLSPVCLVDEACRVLGLTVPPPQ